MVCYCHKPFAKFCFFVLFIFASVFISSVGCTKRSVSAEVKQQEPSSSPGELTKFEPNLRQHKCSYGYAQYQRLRCYDYFSHGVGSGFKIPVVVIEPETKATNPPILYIPGGPGATHVTSSGSVDQWMYWLDYANLSSEIVLFELRGAEPGAPSWQCATFEELSKNLLKQPINGREEASIIAPILDQCLNTFDDKLKKSMPAYLSRAPGAGLNLVSTMQFATDVRNILSLLGEESWWLLGSSYGTRLAMAVAAFNPEVKKVMLDSPYPFGKGNLDDAFVVWSMAFEQMFSQFNAQNMEQLFWQVMSNLKVKPIKVSVENWDSGARVSWVLNSDRLAYVLYNAMYSAESYELIPKALAGLVDSNTKAIQPLLDNFYNNAFDRYFNSMVFIATECNDNGKTSPANFDKVLAKAEEWKPYFSYQIEYDVCASSFFQHSLLPPHLKWSQPTVIASGVLDPVTNAQYASDAHALAENALLIRLQNSSHAEFIDSECGVAIAALFFSGDSKLHDVYKLQTADVCKNWIN